MTGPGSQGGTPPQGATTIFIFGLLGIVVCGILGIVAWVQGNSYRRACQEQGVELEGLATAGWILGIIASVLLIVGVLFGLLWILLLASTMSTM